MAKEHPEATYPYTLRAASGRWNVALTIDGSWNKKVYNIDATDKTIPLGIEAVLENVYHYPHLKKFTDTLNCEKCKLTQYAIDHGVNENYIVGISIQQLMEATSPDSPPPPDPPILPKWAIIGTDAGIVEQSDGNYDLLPDVIPMGALESDTEFKADSGSFQPTGCWGVKEGSEYAEQDSDPLNTLGSYLGNQLGLQNFRVADDYGTWNMDIDVTWHTELPVFDTDAHLLAFIRSGGTVAEGLLNGEQPTVVDDKKDYDYYLNDTFTLYSSYGLSYERSEKFKYQFKIVMKKRGRVKGGLLALVNDPPFTPEDRFPRKYHLIGDEIRSVITWDGDQYVEYTGDDIKNLTFYRTSAGKAGFNYCQVQAWSTNIPFQDGANSEPWARGFLETGNPQGATNIKKIIPKETPITPGTPVDDTPIPTPGISLARGANIYALTSSQVNVFMVKIFDPANIQDLLNGTQLFGANQIGAIRDLFYIPCSADDIATSSSTPDIYLGSYKVEMGTSVKWITKNNKLIDCGTVTFNETFGSYLDIEPNCLLYIWLPGCGVHQLQISKYINKTVKLRYAVSVFDGSCMAILSVNNGTKNIVLDTFTGNFAVHIPLTANDQARQTSAVVQGIMQTSMSAIKTIGTVGAGAVGLGAAAAAGSVSAAGAAGIASDLTAGGMSGGGTIMQAANTLQAAMDAPISTRGALSGMLSLFDTMIPTFIAARLNSIEPENELEIVGKPSASGGKVGSFAGFLKTSAFDMSNFPGTIEEAQEIQRMFSGGVYVD